MNPIITGLQNPRIKNIQKLATKSRSRKEQGLFLIEGAREISLALKKEYILDSVFLCRDLFVKTDYPDILQLIPENILFEVTETVFQKIAYREGSDGVLALAKPKDHSLTNLTVSANPFFIVLESVEKPGNLGAVLRTADAAKVDAVIVCNPLTDIYNPNIIRSSVGCVFTVPVGIADNEATLRFLKKNGICSYAAELTAAQWYQDMDYTSPSAVIMGAEADGLTDFWLNQAEKRIKIPMRGAIDSLNVSVSTAIITFEAMRQRGF
ncbi:MAG: RNA methyltransferase [Dysgonamonadaceae bacterium]|jgi:TrmH family RNA methyltransferase|nr:RNA methyltransferase [Dysgonamonadaceae bacterium]